MNQELFAQYLKERYEKEIEWYDTNSIKNKKYYLWFQWLAISISAIVPVLVLCMPENWKWATSFVAAVLAIITAALKTFKYQENWLSYRTITETLKKEKYYFEAELNDYKNCSDKESKFVERVEALISKEHSLWFSTHNQINDDESDTENNKQ